MVLFLRLWKYNKLFCKFNEMNRKIMVISNSLTLRAEAVRYSIELAKRTESSLLILILPSLDSEELEMLGDKPANNFESIAKDALLKHINAARQEDVTVEVKVNIGDPYSELMKFLAESKSIHPPQWSVPKSRRIRSVKPTKTRLFASRPCLPAPQRNARHSPILKCIAHEDFPERAIPRT